MNNIEFVEIQAGESTATFCTRGGVITSWVVPAGRQSFDVIDGYQSTEEAAEANGARAALLAPWSNRIEDSKYSWQGINFDLGPDKEGVREGLHGLFLDRIFEVSGTGPGWITMSAEIGEDELAISYADGVAYPCPLSLQVRYEIAHTLGSWQLNMRLAATNRGTIPAPIGLGWHPYLRYDGPLEGASITMPARSQILTDDALIPLEGAEAFAPAPTFDPNSGLLRLDDLRGMDTAFTDLTVSTGGEATSTATLHHASGATTQLRAAIAGSGARGYGLFHVFTGEPLKHRPCEAVALEFCQFMTNAYNRPEFTEELLVEPNKSAVMNLSLIHTPHQK
ncbi:hypothetical protein [uncultured Actinomyces sp.]|uniref:aldose 1-epimerase n=1 Tax=uncultured Actinomyces sp. TaxID=249061 RepID=UPI002605E045|nr:hypothetical protein [uncultured Actinomyces sp.]